MKITTMHSHEVISLNSGEISYNVGEFDPSNNTISIDIEHVRSNSVCWKRQVLALFIHELVHWYQWHIICRHDVDKWNDGEWQENQADKVQDFILHLLFVRIS